MGNLGARCRLLGDSTNKSQTDNDSQGQRWEVIGGFVGVGEHHEAANEQSAQDAY